MTAGPRYPTAVTTLALASAFIVAGCGGSNAPADTPKAQRAEQLVSSTRAAGVAPHLTVGVAESMYGSTAPGVCKVFEDGLTTAEKNDLLGNPSGRRPKSITTDAVTYGRLVVKAYCPQQLAHYDAAVKDLDPLTSES
jgi:hypothetical protein